MDIVSRPDVGACLHLSIHLSISHLRDGGAQRAFPRAARREQPEQCTVGGAGGGVLRAARLVRVRIRVRVRVPVAGSSVPRAVNMRQRSCRSSPPPPA